MHAELPFLAHLDLDGTADHGAIRRAYARKLKKIDADIDPAAFQCLRNAYEAALHWCEYAETQCAAEETPAEVLAPAQAERLQAVEPPVREAAVDPALLAAQRAFQSFLDATATLRATPGEDPEESWTQALRQALDAEVMISLQVKLHFEGYVIGLLCAGWRPGHEHLLAAAVAAFGWLGDRRRLYLYGDIGALMNQAMDELTVLRRTLEPDQHTQARMLYHLRQAAVPADYLVRYNMVHGERMFQRCPALLPMIASMDMFRQWRARYVELEGEPPDTSLPPPSAAPVEHKRKGIRPPFWLLILLMLALRLPSLWHSSASPPVSPSAIVGLGPTPELSGPQLAEIAARIKRTPPLGQEWRAVYEVTLGGAGGVNLVTKSRSSGHPEFDRAVEQAIRFSPPFPPETPRVFLVDLTVKGKEHKTVSHAQLADIAHRIRFKEDRNQPCRPLTVSVQIAFDEAGGFTDVLLARSSGDAGYDAAAVAAVRDTKPWGAGYEGGYQMGFRHECRRTAEARGQ